MCIKQNKDIPSCSYCKIPLDRLKTDNRDNFFYNVHIHLKVPT